MMHWSVWVTTMTSMILLRIFGDTANSLQNDAVCCKNKIVAENHTDPNPTQKAPIQASLLNSDPNPTPIQASLQEALILASLLT